MQLLSFIFTLIVASKFLCTLRCEINFNPIITLPQGVLMGETGKTTRLKRDFYKYWCIPYGEVERFEPAVPARPWKGIHQNVECLQRCIQTMIIDIPMMGSGLESEDCLVLNVFTPAKLNPTGELLPVMFWIHGGYFHLGSGLDYTGESFLDEDIVFVTINYRLGAFGFLTTGDGVIEGNLGMKDMILALEWVQTNIRYFGGDPGRVTIFGESAGSGSVSLLLLSPMAKGLFHRAIAQSGSTLSPWCYQSYPQKTFRIFADEMNCSAPTTTEAVRCLKGKTVEEIVEVSKKTKWFIEVVHPLFPSIEVVSPKKSKNFLPEHPRKMLKDGNFNKVPFIIGVMEDEGAYQGALAADDEEFVHDLNHKWIEKGQMAVGIDYRNVSAENITTGLQKLRKFYFGDDTIGLHNVEELVNMFSDSWFVASMDFTVRMHSRHAPVYPYIFTRKSSISLAEMMTGSILNRSVVSHGEDLLYFFFQQFAGGDADKSFADNFMKTWVSFAYDGKPTHPWDAEWPASPPNTYDYYYYILDDKTSLMMNPYKARSTMRDDLDENEWQEVDLE